MREIKQKKGENCDFLFFFIIFQCFFFFLRFFFRSFLLKEHSGGNKSKRYYNLHGSDINLISFTIFYLFPWVNVLCCCYCYCCLHDFVSIKKKFSFFKIYFTAILMMINSILIEHTSKFFFTYLSNNIYGLHWNV